MTQTCFGIALDKTGSASDGAGRFWSTPSFSLRSVQDPRLAVTVEHGRECGQVVFIKRTRGGQVWVVGEIADDVRPEAYARVAGELRSVPVPYWWSVTRFGDKTDGFLLLEASLTAAPARVSPGRPVEFRSGDVAAAAYHASDSWERRLLSAAAEYHRKRRFTDQPLVVVDDDPALPAAASSRLASRTAPLEYRAAAVTNVSGRTVEMVVAPVEQPARVVVDDRWITELYAPAAFAGAEKSPGRVKVNLHHRLEAVIGVATSIDPYALEGCVAVAKIADTERGREAVALCEAGCLDVSAGFRVKPDGVQWPSRDVRVVVAGELHHIALVPDGAYGEAARVTAVRDRELAVY